MVSSTHDAVIVVPGDYSIKPELNGKQYNTLTGWTNAVWHPETGDFFYVPDQHKVYELIRRLSESQPEGMGIPLPEGLALVKDVSTGTEGEANYLNIRKAIPLKRERDNYTECGSGNGNPHARTKEKGKNHDNNGKKNSNKGKESSRSGKEGRSPEGSGKRRICSAHRFRERRL